MNVILIEFNELTPALMDRFIAQGELPNFARFRNESQEFITDAQATGEDLNPWVQWVTVHTGLDLDEHGIKYLSDGCDLSTPALWDIVSEAGENVLVFGSMNGRYDKPLNGYLVPDPWSSGLACYPPDEFETFYSFIRDAVQEHTNPDAKSSTTTAQFVKWMATHGLSPNTVFRVLAQIASEKLGNESWKKAVILDRFQWDVFKKYYKSSKPRLATFFSNSTAHYQHKYWRCMQPELFAAQPTDNEVASYGQAILFGYKQADELIGRFIRLADKDTALVFCTALGQQPYLGHEDSGGRVYYRLKDQHVLTKLGLVSNYRFEPVMAEQFYLKFDTEEDAESAKTTLGGLRTNGAPTFHINPQPRALLVQCQQTGHVDPSVMISGGPHACRFFDVFYRVDGTKSGFHHPDGILWIRLPSREHGVNDDKVSLRDMAPTILQMLEMDKPSYMSGESLLSGKERVAVPT